MAKKKTARGKKVVKAKATGRAAARGYGLGAANEAELLRLIADPCGANLVHGFGLGTRGIVQRFVKYLTPVATTETAFAYYFNPSDHSTAGITQMLGNATGAHTNISTTGPGETFLDANADGISTLAACVEVVYTGKLVDRRGYVGVLQGPSLALSDAVATSVPLADIMSLSQAVQPVATSATTVKWIPNQLDLTGDSRTEAGLRTNTNAIIVVAIGVNPNDFVVRFTAAYEYAPKVSLGMPASRPTITVPPGAPQRIVSALDRMGAWWHNVGDAAAAAYRAGGQMVYGMNQAARLVRGTARALEPAAALLALTG